MSETEASFKSRFFRLDNPNLIFFMVSSLCQRTIIRWCDHFPRSWGSHNIIYPLNQDGLGLCLSKLPRDVVSVTCDAVGPYPSLLPSFKQQPNQRRQKKEAAIVLFSRSPCVQQHALPVRWGECERRWCVYYVACVSTGCFGVKSVLEDHIFLRLWGM